MASKTQLRLGQLTGSFGDFEGGIIDTRGAGSSTLGLIALNSGSMVGVLSELASAVKRIHGGGSFASQAAGVFAGRIQVDDATDATSTTNGSLQTDGGLSVVKDAVLGNDVKLLSDAAVLNFGADSDVSLTHVADTGLLLNSSRQLQFGDADTYVAQSADGILQLRSDATIKAVIGASDALTINSSAATFGQNVIVTGDLTVNGTTTTLDTTNLLVEDVVIGMASNAASYNQNGGLAIFSGSSDSDLVIGRVANDTWGVGKKATLKGTVITLADMTLVPFRASKIEIDGTTNYLDVVSSNLSAVAAANIVLDADGGTLQFKDGGSLIGEIINDTASTSALIISASQGLALTLDAGNVIFAKQGGAIGTTAVLETSTANQITFGYADLSSGVSWDVPGNLVFKTNAVSVLSASNGLQIDAGADAAQLQLLGTNGNYSGFKAYANPGSSYTLTLPSSAGMMGNLLSTDGSGNLSWTSPSTVTFSKGAAVLTSAVTAGSALDLSGLSAIGVFPNNLDQAQYGNVNLFVNGALMLSGSAAAVSAGTVDYRFSGSQTAVFSFNLEIDDVVQVVKSGA